VLLPLLFFLLLPLLLLLLIPGGSLTGCHY